MEDFLVACKTKDEDAILLLLNNINVELIDNDNGMTILHYLIDNEFEDLAIQFVDIVMKNEKYHLLSHVDNNGNTPLLMSCEYEFVILGMKLLDTKYSNSNFIDDMGYSALTICCCNESLEDLGISIICENKNADCIGHPTSDLDKTPLIHACFNSLENISKIIIETNNGNITYIDKHASKNALMYALDSGLEETASLLIDKMDDFNHIDDDQNTALMIACENQFEELALQILEKGNCLNEPLEENSDTALILACANELENVSIKILEMCSDNFDYINHIDEEGCTAFEYACENNLQKVIDKFITVIQVEKVIPILIKHRLYYKLKMLLQNETISDTVQKMLFDELCVSDLLDIIAKVSSSESLDNLDKYIKKLKESPLDCIICYKPTITHYLFNPCKHVLKLDPTCLSKVDECPICRVPIESKEVVFIV
jgi:ankyrin repeat protein